MPPTAGHASRRLNGWLMRRWVKPASLLACGLPLAALVLAAFADRLGANPAEALIRGLGDWALRLLELGLALTPLRRALDLPALARWRRGLGLWAFAYAALHALAWAWLDTGLDAAALVADVAQRPFIAAGVAAFALLLPLAATSCNGAVRRLGAARWKALHRAVHAVAVLALLHFLWMRAGKNDYAEVALHAALVALLLGWRAFDALRSR